MKKLKTSVDFSDFISAYETGELQITDKIKYKIRDIIEKNDQYFHGKFENEYDGSFKKIFYNIGFIIFRTVYQNTDIDTKDIQMRSTNGKGIEALALLKMAIQSYLKRVKFGTFLNDLRYFIKDGTTIVKIVDGSPIIVNNHNIVRPPYGGTVQETGIGEKALYSWSDMLSHKEEWKEAWPQIEKLKEVMDKNKVKDFVVYEFWNEHEFEDGWHKGCIKYLDMQATEPADRMRNSNPSEWEPYLELDRFKTPHKKKRTSKRLRKKLGEYEELYPYKELHFIKVPGRTLGFSVFELIAGIIEAYNRKMNLHDKKDILDLMGIFKHKKANTSPSVAQQLLDNIQSGKVVEMELDEDLERFVIGTKASELIANVDKLMEIAMQIVGVSIQGTGVEMPSSTTATVAIANKQTQQTTYDYAVEQMGIFLTELFEDFYLETILDEIDAEEMNLICGDPTELKVLDEYYTNRLIGKKTEERYNQIEQMSGDVSWEDAQVIDELGMAEKDTILKELEKLGDTRWADIKKEFIKNINYQFEFYVNNESFDKNVKIQNMITMRANTELSTKKIDMALMDLMGENPKAFEKTDEEKMQEIEMLKAKSMAEMPPVPGAITPMGEANSFASANSLTA